jgi:hypothetical protein
VELAILIGLVIDLFLTIIWIVKEPETGDMK